MMHRLEIHYILLCIPYEKSRGEREGEGEYIGFKLFVCPGFNLRDGSTSLVILAIMVYKRKRLLFWELGVEHEGQVYWSK